MSTYSYRWYVSGSRSRFRKDPLPDVEVASFKSCILNSRTGLLAFEEGFPDSRAGSESWDFREGRDRCLRRVSASGVVMSLRMLEPRGEPVSESRGESAGRRPDRQRGDVPHKPFDGASDKSPSRHQQPGRDPPRKPDPRIAIFDRTPLLQRGRLVVAAAKIQPNHTAPRIHGKG